MTFTEYLESKKNEKIMIILSGQKISNLTFKGFMEDNEDFAIFSRDCDVYETVLKVSEIQGAISLKEKWSGNDK